MTRLCIAFAIVTALYAGCASEPTTFVFDDAGTEPLNDSINDCSDDETRCDEDTLQRCDNGMWEEWKDCSDSGKICTITTNGAVCEKEDSDDEENNDDDHDHGDGDDDDDEPDTGDDPFPSGLGEKCNRHADCAGFEADFCAGLPGSDSRCTVKNCTVNPNSCHKGLDALCCDMPFYTGIPNICVHKSVYDSLNCR